MQKIVPSLWFDNNAEEAIKFYLSIFKDAEILDVARYTAAGPGPEGSVMTMSFKLLGEEFLAINGGPHFTFSPAVSFYVKCETQAEIDYHWDKLLAGGKAQQCGWLTDKYGVTWQVVPTVLPKMMMDKDRDRAARVSQAMFKMIKLDIAGLEKAYAA